MKRLGFVVFLTLFVLAAVGAMGREHWYAYAATVLACVALIAKPERYRRVSAHPRAKHLTVAVLSGAALSLLYLQSQGYV